MTSINRDVTAMFNKFAGVEIDMVETEVEVGGQTYKLPEVRFSNPSDPVLTGMQETAQKNKLHLRVWLPGSVGTMDFRMDRVNVNINKDVDGKWRVGKSFTLG